MQAKKVRAGRYKVPIGSFWALNPDAVGPESELLQR